MEEWSLEKLRYDIPDGPKDETEAKALLKLIKGAHPLAVALKGGVSLKRLERWYEAAVRIQTDFEQLRRSTVSASTKALPDGEPIYKVRKRVRPHPGVPKSKYVYYPMSFHEPPDSVDEFMDFVENNGNGSYQILEVHSGKVAGILYATEQEFEDPTDVQEESKPSLDSKLSNKKLRKWGQFLEEIGDKLYGRREMYDELIICALRDGDLHFAERLKRLRDEELNQ